MSLICPTCQLAFEASMPAACYFAWGCFRYFGERAPWGAQAATIAAPAQTQLDPALVGRHRCPRQAPARAIEHRDPQGLERRIIVRLRADRDARKHHRQPFT